MKDGDIIEIDIPNCRIELMVSEEELAERRAEQDKLGWKPANRRERSFLCQKVYGYFATSGGQGGSTEIKNEDIKLKCGVFYSRNGSENGTFCKKKLVMINKNNQNQLLSTVLF